LGSRSHGVINLLPVQESQGSGCLVGLTLHEEPQGVSPVQDNPIPSDPRVCILGKV
jgi:hypothetical protein